MFSFLPCLFVFLINATPITSMDMIYKMNIMENEESSPSDCGRNITLPLDDYKHEVVSYGYVGGDCSVNFVLNISSTCPCKICMRKVEWELNADVMNITFTGESEKKILKFRQTELDEFCFEGRTLNIHLVENEDYFLKEKPSHVYDFQFALNPNCSRNPDEFICKLSTTPPVIEPSFTLMTITYSDDFNKAAGLKQNNTMNIVYGVTVANLTLTVVFVVFVVVLLFTYCFCKNYYKGCKRRSQQETPGVGQNTIDTRHESKPMRSGDTPGTSSVATEDDRRCCCYPGRRPRFTNHQNQPVHERKGGEGQGEEMEELHTSSS